MFIPGISINITCADQLFAWVDGKYQNVSNWDDDEKVGTIDIPNGKHVLAMMCVNQGNLGGILWSRNNPPYMISNSTTSCSTVFQPRWNLKKFEPDQNWGPAQSYGRSDQSPLGRRDGIIYFAEWIWMGPQNGMEKATIYCRKEFKLK